MYSIWCGILQRRIGLIQILFAASLCLTFSCSQPAGDNRNGNSAEIERVFPRLIITGEHLQELALSVETTHKQLYKLTLHLADDFAAEEPHPGLNAGNRNRRIGESLPSLGLAYLLTREDKYLFGAEKWIGAMMDVESWEGSQNLGRSAWVTGVAQTYDWLHHELDDQLKNQIITRLSRETEIIISTASSTRALSNHLLIETSAIGTVGLILDKEDSNRERFLEQADEWTRYIIDNAPLDGSWGEGVQYWQYGLGYFLRFLEGASTSGYHDYFGEYEWLKKTGRFPLQFSVPDRLTRVINFSDCGTDRYLPAALLYLPASKYRDGVVQDFAMKIQDTVPHKLSWFDFLTYDASLDPVDYRTVEGCFHHFTDHGFVTMRSSWEEDATLVGFRCGPGPGHANQVKPERLSHRGYGPGHQHPDINNFVVYTNGTWLAIDPGYSKLKETRNHNTLIVNGKGQAGAGKKWLDYMAFQNREPAPGITLVETSGEVDYIIGNAGNIYVDEAGLDYFERQLMFVKPDVIIIADRLKAKRNSTFEWLLQANEIAEVIKTSEGFEVVKEGASLSLFPLLPAEIHSGVTERMVEASDVNGSPDYDRDKALLKTITLRSEGSETEYLVVLAVNRPGETRPEVSMSEGLVHIEKEDKETLIKYEPGRELSLKILDLVKQD